MKKADLRPGDLIFITAKYTDLLKPPKRYNVVHIEIYLGPHDETVGSRSEGWWYQGQQEAHQQQRQCQRGGESNGRRESNSDSGSSGDNSSSSTISSITSGMRRSSSNRRSSSISCSNDIATSSSLANSTVESGYGQPHAEQPHHQLPHHAPQALHHQGPPEPEGDGVQLYRSYKCVSSRWIPSTVKYHFRSIEPWLLGECPSVTSLIDGERRRIEQGRYTSDGIRYSSGAGASTLRHCAQKMLAMS